MADMYGLNCVKEYRSLMRKGEEDKAKDLVVSHPEMWKELQDYYNNLMNCHPAERAVFVMTNPFFFEDAKKEQDFLEAIISKQN